MRINSTYIIRNVFGKMILIPYKRTKIGNHPIYLNETGRVIIEKLGESASEIELCQKVAQEYNLKTDSEEFEQIKIFVANLVDMDVVLR